MFLIYFLNKSANNRLKNIAFCSCKTRLKKRGPNSPAFPYMFCPPSMRIRSKCSKQTPQFSHHPFSRIALRMPNS